MATHISKWMPLESFDFTPHKLCGVMQVDENNFIVVSASHKAMFTLYKYDAIKHDFNTLSIGQVTRTNNEDCVTSFEDIIAFNKVKQEMYVLHKDCGSYTKTHIQAININNKSQQILEYIPTGRYFLFINNCFHLFDNHNKHRIYHTKNEKLCLKNTLWNHTVEDLDAGLAIYVPSKQFIVLIGGHGYNGDLRKDIWCYSLRTQKWSRIEYMTFTGYNFGIVLTSNERYIILFGGTNDEQARDTEVDDILVLDMKDDNNWKLKKSKIFCPEVGACHIVRTGGVNAKYDVLVIGFIKQCFEQKEFEHLDLPPIYIMMIIVKWFSAEMIHWN
eukprot:225661_1